MSLHLPHRRALLSRSTLPIVGTYIGSASDTTDLTTYNFGNFDVGAAGGLVVVAAAARAAGNRTLSSVSIGGSNGVIAAATPSGTVPCGIAYRVASGVINVSASFSAAVQNATMAVWCLTNYQSPTAYDTAQTVGAVADGASVAATLSLGIPKGGFAVFVHEHTNFNATSWSGATGRADLTVESAVKHAFADLAAVNAALLNYTETASWTSNAVRALAAASFR